MLIYFLKFLELCFLQVIETQKYAKVIDFWRCPRNAPPPPPPPPQYSTGTANRRKVWTILTLGYRQKMRNDLCRPIDSGLHNFVWRRYKAFFRDELLEFLDTISVILTFVQAIVPAECKARFGFGCFVLFLGGVGRSLDVWNEELK